MSMSDYSKPGLYAQSAPEEVIHPDKGKGSHDTTKTLSSSLHPSSSSSLYASSEFCGHRWPLSKNELTSSSHSLLQWLARFPIQNNHPRALTGKTPQIKVASDEVLVVNQNDRVHAAWEKLTAEGFTGAPIVDYNERYVGYLELQDIVCYACELFRAWTGIHYQIPAQPELKQRWESFFQVDRYKELRVNDLVHRPDLMRSRQVCYPAYQGFSTLWAIEQMARLGCHRVPILTGKHKVHGLLTQSMAISLLDQNLEELGELRHCKVSDILPGLAYECKTVSEESEAISAFSTMAHLGITGLGVTNKEGSLTDVISARDLRGLGCSFEHFELMWTTVKKFKKAARERFPQQTPPRPITVTRTDTLETVIRAFDDGNLARVFVVDRMSDGCELPSHVITQCDVLRLLCHHMGLDVVHRVQPMSM